ncbi:SMP-30/gluconolactonase/LRE family protein [bacterium]|nr:SMP-30/gluconolactonase/LRE family protein [bacterium]
MTRLLISLLLTAALHAQNPYEFYFKSLNDYQKRDYNAFLENAKKAYNLAPIQIEFNHNLSRAYALKGQHEQALELLKKITAMGFDFSPQTDSAYAALWDSCELKTIVRDWNRLEVPTNVSKKAFSVDEKDLIPEGITYDPLNQLFYLSSIYKRKIVSVDKKRVAKDFASEAQDDLWSTLGMKVDGFRRTLWVASVIGSPRMKGYDEKDQGRSAIFKYDVDKGTLIKKYVVSNKPKAHLFNDVTFTPNGDLFITDSETGSIYVITAAGDSLEVFLAEKFIYPNGIVLNDDGYLYVAHWQGVSRIDLMTKTVVDLTCPATTTLTGIDGLYWHKNALIAVQNGAGPHARIMRFFLNATGDGVDRAEILEYGNPIYNIPTTGVIVNNEFYFIANSQLRSFTEDGKIFDLDQLKEPVVMKVKL